jgi:beta-lactamase regulating signal transducer with metallopeptidase domain
MAWWIFQHVVSTAALAAGVAIVCRVARLSPVVRHALWVIVLVKFVMPPLVVWPWAVPDPFGVSTLDRRGADWTAPSVRFDPGVAARDAVAGASAAAADGPAADQSGDATTSGAGASSWLWLVSVWAAGSLCVLGVEAVRIAQLARRVRMAAPADPAIVTRVAALSARLGVRPVPVVAVSGATSPVVWCLGRPRLLWPDVLPADLTGAWIDGVVVHELAHVKRRDHLVGWIELAAGTAWWWNPLFWLVRSARREQAELSCDAWVIASLPDGRRAYAESLIALSAAAGGHHSASSMAAVVGIGSGSRRALERRLVMIMKGRASLRMPIAALLTLLLTAAATLPAWATGSQQQAPPPPARVRVPVAPRVEVLPAPRPAVQVPVAPVRVTPAPQQTPPRRVLDLTVSARTLIVRIDDSGLPAQGRQLLEGFEADRDAIQEEAEQKIAARREAVVQALQDLQDQLTKAGQLDEAVAVRDYLRAGGPGGDLPLRVFKRVR